LSIDDTRKPPNNRWNPLGMGPHAASGTRRRILAVHTGTSAALRDPLPEPLPRESVSLPAPAPAPVSEHDSAADEILEMIAKANPEGSAARQRSDFNSELMARTLDAAARARLTSGLHRLVAAGLLVRRSESEYSITEMGMFSMRQGWTSKASTTT
jgi:hypothetical protein